METVKVNTSQHVAIDYPVAGLGERIAARSIDLACFFVLYILVIILALVGGLSGLSNTSPYVFFAAVGLYLTAYIFYNLICEIFMNGQSIGKRLMKIKVISLDGGQASIGQYFIRWVFRLADFVLTGQMGGLICIALTENKQRIGDVVAGTTVIKTVPRTNFGNIAFQQPEEVDYVPVFSNIQQLTERDIELIHEVLSAYYKNFNDQLIVAMAEKIKAMLNVELPEGMTTVNFLQTIIKDYSHVTART
ncbi:MAG: RDD family protein [Bacteroidota bacterium]